MKSKNKTFVACLFIAQLMMIGCASSIDMRVEEAENLTEFEKPEFSGVEPVVTNDKTLASPPSSNETYCFDLEEPIKEETLGSEAFAYECPDLSASPLIVYCENGCQTVCASFTHLASDNRCEVILYSEGLETEDGDTVPEQTIPADSQPAEETVTKAPETPTSDKKEFVESSKESPKIPDKTTDQTTTEKITDTTDQKSDTKDSGEEKSVEIPQDTSCPTVVSSIPPDGATGVGGDILVFCFDEPMDPASFAIDDLLINPAISVASASTSNNCVTYKLEKPLFCGPIEYQVKLVGGVDGPTDLAKNPLCASFPIHFFTAKCALVTDPISVKTADTVTATDTTKVSTNITPKDDTLTTSIITNDKETSLDISKGTTTTNILDTSTSLNSKDSLSKTSTTSITTNLNGTLDASKDLSSSTSKNIISPTKDNKETTTTKGSTSAGTVASPTTKSSTNSTTTK